MDYPSKLDNGDLLTGRVWRKDHPFLKEMPFYCDFARMDSLSNSLEVAFGEGRCYCALLVKLGRGLDEGHPFSDTPAADVLLRETLKILSKEWEDIGSRNASRIWAYFSKYVMLDRFSKTLGVSRVHPAGPSMRSSCSLESFGTAAKIVEELNPPTKLIGRFLKTWVDREKKLANYNTIPPTTSSAGPRDPAGIALSLSRRLIAVVKVKNILNIESGLEMIALAMAISAEVAKLEFLFFHQADRSFPISVLKNNGVFPELESEVKIVLQRIWQDRMDSNQLGEISFEIETLHKSMKNMIEITFAISPLLALSSRSWATRSVHSSYLLRTFCALGNNRPQILVDMEDSVLEAIIAISEGSPREYVMQNLYNKINTLSCDLSEEALTWFEFPSTTPANPSSPQSITSHAYPSTPRQVEIPSTNMVFQKQKFQGGLASPPESRNNTPIVNDAASLTLSSQDKIPPPTFSSNAVPRSTKPSTLVPGSRGQSISPLTPVSKSVPLDSPERPMVSTSSLLPTSTTIALDASEQQPMLSSVFGPPKNLVSEDMEEGEPNSSVALSGEEISPIEDVDLDGHPTVSLAADDVRNGDTDLEDMVVDTTPMVVEDEEEDVVVMVAVNSRAPSSDVRETRGPSEEVVNDGSIAVGEEGVPGRSLRGEKEGTSPSMVEEERGMVVDSNAPSLDPITSPDTFTTQAAVRVEHPKTPLKVVCMQTVDPRVPKHLYKRKANSVEDSVLDSSPTAVAAFEPRRSLRNNSARDPPPFIKPAAYRKVGTAKRKPALRKAVFHLEEESDDEIPGLSQVEKSTYHPTIYAEIVGWGATVEAGPKPYRHVPVQVVAPGDPDSTGDDTETLKRVEARIQSNFINGLPPHLQPNAKSIPYRAGSNQSQIFVASHSEFSVLKARDIQAILRNRTILVHDVPMGYRYGWDLESFGLLYDVDKKTTVQVSSKFHPHRPDFRHHLGTLRELHEITSNLSIDDCLPLNAISLPGHERNLFVPPQFGSMASNEVAQSRVPSNYKSKFQVPELKSHLEWSLIGGRGSVSPFHVDPEGLNTVVVVLEGEKYWILITEKGDKKPISSVDSLGPSWNPYFVNNEDDINDFGFEGVHLQKGDMLIMPGGTPHWVLGTSNAICVGRHFYSASTIRSSVNTIVHTSFLRGSATNEDHLVTRSLLYQLLVFWSTRLEKTDVDGAHIPDISTAEGFLDILYLGVFVILSPAFDDRFLNRSRPPPALSEEIKHAVAHFHSILHNFSLRYIVFFKGNPVHHTYIVGRMLAEFAAAAVNFKNAITDLAENEYAGDEERSEAISSPFQDIVEEILLASHPRLFPYFCRCLYEDHKVFLHSDLQIEIFPRSKEIVSILSLSTAGEILDDPSHPIYHDQSVPILKPVEVLSLSDLNGKPAEGEPPTKKQKRQP